jgi:hypothetical protein
VEGIIAVRHGEWMKIKWRLEVAAKLKGHYKFQEASRTCLDAMKALISKEDRKNCKVKT